MTTRVDAVIGQWMKGKDEGKIITLDIGLEGKRQSSVTSMESMTPVQTPKISGLESFLAHTIVPMYLHS